MYLKNSETWQAMEALVEQGLTKKIGVCNFNIGLIRELMTFAKVKPFMNQVELHPYLVQKNLRKVCREYGKLLGFYIIFLNIIYQGINVTAYSSFGALSYYSISNGFAESFHLSWLSRKLSKFPKTIRKPLDRFC